MSLTTISPREASIFACLTDTVVAPEPVLPPVRETDAVEYFDRFARRSPTLNRLGLRALMYAVELGPLVTGFGRRMRRLDPSERTRYMHAIEHARNPRLRQLAKLVQGIGQLAYYGDDSIMLSLGYDADANVARGRELRALEARP